MGDVVFPWFLPAGELTLLVGDPGVGKSLVGIDWAARLVGGRRLDVKDAAWERDAGGDSGVALVSSAEDSKAVMEARIEAAGAPEKSVVVMPEEVASLVPRRGKVGGSGFNSDAESPLVGFLEGQLRKGDFGLRLVVLDPLPAFLGKYDGPGSVVRSLVRPVVKLAEKYGFAVLGITHLKKKWTENVLHRTIGALAYTALARSVIVAMRDERSARGRRRLILPVKSNRVDVTHGMAFRIVGWGEKFGAAKVEWEQEAVEGHVLLGGMEEVKDLKDREQEMEATELSFAITFLRESLRDGPVPSTELVKEARAMGISQRTLERAREVAGVVPVKVGGEWVVELSGEEVEGKGTEALRH